MAVRLGFLLRVACSLASEEEVLDAKIRVPLLLVERIVHFLSLFSFAKPVTSGVSLPGFSRNYQRILLGTLVNRIAEEFQVKPRRRFAFTL